MTARGAVRTTVALVAAVTATAIAGSIVQTQFNLLAITRLGVAVPVDVRVATTAEDVVRFGPIMALIAVASFVPAFSVAALAGQRVATGRPRLRMALAGAAGLWAAFSFMGLVTPMPTLVAAARTWFGLLFLCATGLLGGLVFASVLDRPSRLEKV